ncbi:alpha/beta-hydrolase [Calocera cornea HHB12733]|uniref:Carboxypeptidase n=1 Tax=Calocera cornea HHB12733 TaxID=1353952 RepID=A0A165GIS5_9BASI|nr:alpha/beta-hydrolase [Calocera cornea HHB12733]
MQVFGIGILLTALAAAIQLPLHFDPSYGSKSSSPGQAAAPLTSSTPQLSLSDVSSDQYTISTHERFAGYALRIKRTEWWCDPSVWSWTGYLDVDGGAKHMFFYFFESRRAPAEDPLLMWINGGPGCSASLGLFMELGPCKINDHGNDTIPRIESWNERANVFFLDQPVGVGFSYAEYGETVETTEDAARNVAAFVWLFMETFTEYKGREFHMAGESYGGRYLPVFASEIVDRNKRATSNGLQEINLKSVMIGNGDTDHINMYPSIYKMLCTNASLPPVLSIGECVRMKRALPRCMQMATASCVDILDELACQAAQRVCSAELEQPFFTSKINSYDMSKPCEGYGSAPEMLCYSYTARIGKYLNMNSTRKLLGVDDEVTHFSACSFEVGALFERRMDRYAPGSYFIAGLLERGVSVLIYVGVYDAICNFIANRELTERLEWHGKEAYNAEPTRPWFVDGEPAGITKGWKGLTYANVAGAGHMVPYDKPVQALAMLNRWLENRTL